MESTQTRYSFIPPVPKFDSVNMLARYLLFCLDFDKVSIILTVRYLERAARLGTDLVAFKAIIQISTIIRFEPC